MDLSILEKLPRRSNIFVKKTRLKIKMSKIEFIIKEIEKHISKINKIKVRDRKEQKKILRDLYGLEIKFEHDMSDESVLKIKSIENTGVAKDQLILLVLLLLNSKSSEIYFHYYIDRRPILGDPLYLMKIINNIVSIQIAVNQDEELIADNYTLRYSLAIVYKFLVRSDLKKRLGHQSGLINLVLKYISLPLGMTLLDIPDVKRCDLDQITHNVVFMTH